VKLTVLYFITLVLFINTAPGQSANATVSGIVLDPSGGVIAGADVLIVNDATAVQYPGKTNNEGYYVVANIPPGTYRIQVSNSGFKTIIKPDIVVHVEDALAINFTLPIGAASEIVTVEGGVPLINTESAAVGTVVDSKYVANIPLNGRSFQDLISLTPGVVTQSPQTAASQGVGVTGDFSVNGQRTESNYYTVDGVTGNISSGFPVGGPLPATSGSLGASTALGTTQSLISVDALQEFRINSSSYSAEYGRSPGGQFSLVTRSGTNQLHGTAFDYLRNDAFDANDWFNDSFGKKKTPLRQNDFGGTLGGPVWIPGVYNGKDKTFFFVSYEGLRLKQPQAASIQYVPDTFMRQQAPAALQPILNAFPMQNGTDFGTASAPSLAQFIQPYSLPSRIDSTNLRFDQTFGPRLSLFFRFADTPSYVASRTLSSVTNNHMNAQTYTLGAGSQFSNRTNEFRILYARANSTSRSTLDSFGGATPIDLAAAMGAGSPNPILAFDILIPGLGLSSLPAQIESNVGRQWNVVDTFGLSWGRHQLKFGIDYRKIKSPLIPANPFVEPVFVGGNSVLDNNANVLVLQKTLPATPIFDEISIFAQDEWRVTPRLNLSFGLRWELDPPPTEAHGNDAFTLLGSLSNPSSLAVAPRGTPLWKTSWYNFAPRLGLAWVARAKPGWETVVRTGGGGFFDSDNTLAATGFDNFGFSALSIKFGVPIPVTPTLLNFSPSTSPPYTSAAIIAFPSHLQLPYALEWNASIQQALGTLQALTISYVGSSGRRLIELQRLALGSLNPDFGSVEVVQGGITSNYQALQVQFQRSVSRGMRALASYTWSHSIDFGSNDAAYPSTRGNSDFDLRHNFQGGVTWDLPAFNGNKSAQALLNHWGLDGRLIARTGFPVTLNGNFLTDPATGSQFYGNVNLVQGQPIYLYGSMYPGGRAINPAAFSLPVGSDLGNAPRNFVRGFGAVQLNLAVRREFPLGDRLALQFRAEAFNVLNHPNFGLIDATLGDATFGQATKMLNQSLPTVSSLYQQGGPRSMQLALKLVF
jgi:hypothetical protein